MASKKKLLQAAAGSAGGEVLDIDDVFSTYLYEGNNAIKVIDNGIALGNAGDGGSGEFVLNGGGSNEAGYLSIPSSTDFGFGTGDFTIEMFVYPRATQGYSGFFSTINTGTPVGVMVGTFSDGTLTFDFNSTSGGSSEASALTNGAWSHVALTRNGTSVNLWVNGTSVATATNSDNLGSSESAVIGRFYTTMNGFGFNGHLSNVRVIKGTALYTSSFTAPTSALTAVSGTVLLTLQGDEPFTDNSSSSHTLTANSTVYTSAFGPFTGTSGEGGLVWIRKRLATDNHALFDTERGVNKILKSNETDTSSQLNNSVTAFNSNGFSLGDNTTVNNGDGGIYSSFVSWTWRKAPKFFDVVTYTGDGNDNRTVSHNLGSSPGVVIVKKTSAADSWIVWHRSVPTGYLSLNVASGLQNFTSRIKSANDTTFTLGTSGQTNSNGASYVAYLFAHNNSDGEFGPDSDQDIIKCGSYTGNGSTTGPEINLGFEPQWVIVKNATSAASWNMFDIMRGLATGSGDTLKRLYADTSGAESNSKGLEPTSTGFKLTQAYSGINASSANYIYMAIRRGPLAEPTSATDVFDVTTWTSSGEPKFQTTFASDMAMNRNVNSAYDMRIASRLTQGKFLYTDLSNAEASNSNYVFDYMNGFLASGGSSDFYSWQWKRAPGYFDVVAYTGTGSATTVSHNLGVAPEMMWIKNRDNVRDWNVYHSAIGATKYLKLNGSNAEQTSSTRHNDTEPTASVFTVGTATPVNTSGENYIAYLFATVAGISKVGSFTGTAATQTIDCGFSSGARFVLIKETNTTGGWMVFDTERGIVSGNDARLELDDNGAESTASDILDPHSSGFQLPSSSFVNASGRECIFYAIA